MAMISCRALFFQRTVFVFRTKTRVRVQRMRMLVSTCINAKRNWFLGRKLIVPCYCISRDSPITRGTVTNNIIYRVIYLICCKYFWDSKLVFIIWTVLICYWYLKKHPNCLYIKTFPFYNAICRLKSREPSPRTSVRPRMLDFNINNEWRYEWSHTYETTSSKISNYHSRWFSISESILYRVRTVCGRCASSLFQWGMTNSLLCDYGAERQRIEHILYECLLRLYPGPTTGFERLIRDVICWLEDLDVRFWSSLLMLIFIHL